MVIYAHLEGFGTVNVRLFMFVWEDSAQLVYVHLEGFLFNVMLRVEKK